MSNRAQWPFGWLTPVIFIVLAGAAGLVGIVGLRADFSMAQAEQVHLRNLYQIGVHVQSARVMLSLNPPQFDQAKAELVRALNQNTIQSDRNEPGEQSLVSALTAASASDSPDLDTILAAMVKIDAHERALIDDAQNRADAKRRMTIIVVAIFLAGAIIAAISVGFVQHRALLASNVQLLRSRQLAGVGILAAGVAHEINNPLGIITAHAELSLEALRKNPGPKSELEVAKTLAIVCDEAFRCKRIVDQLLSLARSPDKMVPFSLGVLTREVVTNVEKLPDAQDRQIAFDITPFSDTVDGRPEEIRQVILNLLINAFHATNSGGNVSIRIAPNDDHIELTVMDDGNGIAPDMIQKILQPLISDPSGKVPTAPRGTGLGLSIAHAIIERHGGNLSVFSEGPGKGSRFIVSFPPPLSAKA